MIHTRLACVLPLLVLACAPEEEPEPLDTTVVEADLEIAWAVRFGSNEALCGASYPAVGSTGASARFDGLRLYVHDVRVIFEDGTEAPLVLDDAPPFQDGTVALLDFEDGSSTCTAGDVGTNHRITGRAPVERANADQTARVRAVGLAFTMGLPFDLNHTVLDSASQPPLDVEAMYRNPTTGREFLRLDLTGPNNTDWPIYLHSSGCTGEPGMEPTCAAENLVEHVFPTFDADADTIVIDLLPLLGGSDVSRNATVTTPGGATFDTAPGCQSDPNDPDCSQVFDRYGVGAAAPQFLTFE